MVDGFGQSHRIGAVRINRDAHHLGPGGTSSGNLYNLAGFLAEPPLTRTVPANKRASRELLIAIANSYFDGLTTHDGSIIMAHPGWPWVEETTAVALNKGNVYWEMSGWAPKYFPGNLKVDMRARLQDKVMFGSDYPSLPYARILKEWQELGYTDAVMEKIFHKNAERVLGL